MTARLIVLLLVLLAGPAAFAAELPVSPVRLVHESRLAVGSNDFPTAIARAREAVRADPAYGEAWKQLGRAQMLAGASGDAAASFATARELLGNDPDLHPWGLSLMLDLDRHRDVVAAFDAMSAAEAAHLDPQVVARMLTAMYEAEDIEGARRIARRWAELTGEPGVSAASAALTLLAENNISGAAERLAAVTTPSPDAAPVVALAWDRIGQAQVQAGALDAAPASFSNALAIAPDWLTALRNLGWAHRVADRNDAAITAWQRGVDTRTNALPWLAWIAEAQFDDGRPADAAETAAKLLERIPTHARAATVRLAALVAANDPGADAFEAQIRAMPGGPEIATRGRAWGDRYTQRYEAAAQRLEQQHATDPSNEVVRAQLVETYLAWAAASPRREAVAILDRALRIDPGNAAAKRDMGWALWARGDREQAVAYLDAAIRAGVGNKVDVIRQAYAGLVDAGDIVQADSRLEAWAPDLPRVEIGETLIARGRIDPAERALSTAWATGENPIRTGLLLAHARVLQGRCGDLSPLLEPFASQDLGQVDPVDADRLYETLAICADDPESFALARRIEQQRGARPAFSREVTDSIELAADRRRAARDYAHALRLYRRVLARDPDRPSWARAADCAEALGRRSVAVNFLESLRERTSSDMIRAGIDGRLADYRGDRAAAIAAYRRVLDLDPNQPEIRYALFSALVQDGNLAAAREHVAWFVDRYDQGDASTRREIAEMWGALGETEDALTFWTALGEAQPDTPYYTIERARALQGLGRTAEAVDILERLNERAEDARSYELLAEIQAAIPDPARVLDLTAKGLEIEVTPALLRLRAAAAAALGDSAAAYEAAAALLAVDPGDTQMARIAGDALVAQRKWDEARAFLTGLVARNAEFLPALESLRRVAAAQADFAGAVRHAETVASQRPWDLDAQRRLATALAEDERWGAALDVLRRHVSRDPTQAVAAIVFRDVVRGRQAGRVRAEQVIEHLRALKAAGYTFRTPDEIQLDALPPGSNIVVIIADAEPQSLIEIDAALAEIGGRATYAGYTTGEDREIPGRATIAARRELAASGRWHLASSGPPDLRRIAVTRSGTLGNPLTQRRAASGAEESDAEMQDRIDGILADMASALNGPPRVLLYPRGDYGHLSLDTDAAAIENLHLVAGRRFTLAFADDDAGFITPASDPLRLPARLIPPDWSPEQLLTHLRNANPFPNLQLAYAKILCWNRQHEPANEWFRIALANGADPREVYYHWGANAFHQGDIRRAEEILRRALSLDPDDTTVAAMLDRARAARAPGASSIVAFERESARRTGWQVASAAHGFLGASVRAEAILDWNEWRQRGRGAEEAIRAGGALRWYARPESWIDARLWHLEYGGRREDLIGALARVRLPATWLRGDVMAEVGREEIGTVDAIRAGDHQWKTVGRLHSRVVDEIDLHVNFAFIDRDDHNETWETDARLLYRFQQWPFWAAGLVGRWADSDFAPSGYYAPIEAEQYQAYVGTRSAAGRWGWTASAQAGPGRDQNDDWDLLWGGRLLIQYDVRRRAFPFLDIVYDETPSFHRFIATAGIDVRF